MVQRNEDARTDETIGRLMQMAKTGDLAAIEKLAVMARRGYTPPHNEIVVDGIAPDQAVAAESNNFFLTAHPTVPISQQRPETRPGWSRRHLTSGVTVGTKRVNGGMDVSFWANDGGNLWIPLVRISATMTDEKLSKVQVNGVDVWTKQR